MLKAMAIVGIHPELLPFAGVIARLASAAKHVTPCDTIERPGALDTKGIHHDTEASVSVAMENIQAEQDISEVTANDYLTSNTSARVVKVILSTARHHRAWSGMRG